MPGATPGLLTKLVQCEVCVGFGGSSSPDNANVKPSLQTTQPAPRLLRQGRRSLTALSHRSRPGFTVPLGRRSAATSRGYPLARKAQPACAPWMGDHEGTVPSNTPGSRFSARNHFLQEVKSSTTLREWGLSSAPSEVGGQVDTWKPGWEEQENPSPPEATGIPVLVATDRAERRAWLPDGLPAPSVWFLAGL